MSRIGRVIVDAQIDQEISNKVASKISEIEGLTADQKTPMRIDVLEDDHEQHPCPECDAEMTIEDMIEHRLLEHGISVVDQLEDVPETLGDLDDKDGGGN